jgi:hypothetical protein
MQKTTIWLSESDKQDLREFYPRGAISKVIRGLIARHLARLKSKTAEHVGEQLTEREIEL